MRFYHGRRPEGGRKMGDWCKHYTGLHNETCTKGHRYSIFGPQFGIAKIIPCILRNENPKPCADLERKTPEEIAAEDKEFDDLIAMILVLRPKILRQGQDVGQVECPKCGRALDYVIAPNRHIHARCTTSDCLQWME